MKILILEDDVSLYNLLKRFTDGLTDVKGNGIQLVFTKSIDEFKKKFGNGSEYAAVVLDDHLVGAGKAECALQSGLLDWVREQNPRIPIACNSVGLSINFDPIKYAEEKGVPNFQKNLMDFREFVAGLCK